MAERKLGGSPDNILQVVDWLRISAMRMEIALDIVRQAAMSSIAAWNDLAGQRFVTNLYNGCFNAEKLIRHFYDLADLFEACANSLGEAQSLMSQAEVIALNAGLRVEEGWIAYPKLDDTKTPNPYDIEDQRATWSQWEFQVARFTEAEKKVERAANLVVDQLDRIVKKRIELGNQIFTAVDFAIGTEVELIEQYKIRRLRDGVFHRRIGRESLENARASAGLRILEQTYLEHAHEHAYQLGTSIRMAQTAGVMAKIIERSAGPFILVVGAAYDLYQGDPVEKVIFTNAVGWAAGAGSAPLFIAAGASGVGLVGLTVAAGAVAGMIAGELYDHMFPESAIDRLFPAD